MTMTAVPWSSTSYIFTQEDVDTWDISNLKSFDNLFNDFKGTVIDISKLTFNQNITSMNSMFKGCSEVTEIIGLENINTSNVTNTINTFYNCASLKSLNISSWNMGKVTNMSSMFNGCSSITNIDLSNWNVSKATDMSSMFRNCSSMTHLDLSRWVVDNVQNMPDMFNGCSKLNSLTLNWDLSHVLVLRGMFQGAGLSKIEGITFSEEPPYNNDVNQRRNISNFARACPNLTSIDIDLRGFCRHDEMFRESPNISYIKSIDFTYDIIPNTNFAWATNLTKLTDLNLTGTISVSIPHGFNNMPNLTIKCLTDIINALVDLSGSDSKICYLGATNLAKLSSDVIAIATNKNWTLQ